MSVTTDGDGITISRLVEEIVGEKANPRVTPLGWNVSGAICLLLWMMSWMKVQDVMPDQYHILFGIPSAVCCLGASAIVVSLFGLFKRPLRAVLQIALRSLLMAAIASGLIVLMAIAAALEA